MQQKQTLKIVTDIFMTILLLCLMTYSRLGEELHEWLGIGIFVLYIVHHVLNIRWSKSLFKGNYTPYRILQTILAVLVLIAMLGSMTSGIVLSRYTFSFLSMRKGRAFARTVHMLSAYWGYVFISLHIGLHWSMMIGRLTKKFKNHSHMIKWILRITSILFICNGGYAFIKRKLVGYILLKVQFAFYDFNEPLILLLIDYLSIMGVFIFIGHYLSKALKHHK